MFRKKHKMKSNLITEVFIIFIGVLRNFPKNKQIYKQNKNFNKCMYYYCKMSLNSIIF